MINTRTILPAALAVMLAGPALADDLTDAAQGLCLTVRSCVLEQMAERDLTPEAKEMMAPILDNMCDTMRSQVTEVPVGHKLYRPAVECMRSLESLTCDQFQHHERVSTPECVEYEKLAKEAGVTEQ